MKASPFFNQETLKSVRLNRKSPFYRRKSSSDYDNDMKCPVRVSFEIIKRSRTLSPQTPLRFTNRLFRTSD